MKLISKLASSLGRRDELPNKELAKMIVSKNDKQAVKELIELLQTSKIQIQSDCIKVIYEIADAKAELISPYLSEIISLLDSKNNRIQWGTMHAIHALTAGNPQKIYHALPKIVDVADHGTVITNDHYVGILVQLGRSKNYYEDVMPLLLEKIESCPTNQLPSYAEQTLQIIKGKHVKNLTDTIIKRLPEVPQMPKQTRLKKVLKSLEHKT